MCVSPKFSSTSDTLNCANCQRNVNFIIVIGGIELCVECYPKCTFSGPGATCHITGLEIPDGR